MNIPNPIEDGIPGVPERCHGVTAYPYTREKCSANGADMSEPNPTPALGQGNVSCWPHSKEGA